MPPKKFPTVWKAEPHTIAKIEILQSYLVAWFQIFGQSRSRRDQDLLYVDGFAGPGEYTNHPIGSPLAALTSAQHALELTGIRWIAGDVHCAFIEPDLERYKNLEQKIGSFDKPAMIVTHAYPETFTRGLESLKKDIPQPFSSQHPLFVFIDPFGATGVPFSVVAELLVDLPKKWKRPRIVFVNSMSDLFQEQVPLNFIRRVFETMRQCPQHQFQVLTMRAERLVELSGDLKWSTNIWMGVSIESQEYAYRSKLLRSVPAAVRFLSVEPLLGEIDRLPLQGIHWVIVGGESGPGARPMKQEWVETIYQQCRARGVPFFFKQWGGVQKRRTGRELFGQTFDEMPIAAGA